MRETGLAGPRSARSRAARWRSSSWSPGSRGSGRVQREAAPAGADLQHMVVRAEVKLLADALELRERRLLSVMPGRSNSAEEYIMVWSSISAKSSLPRS